MNRHDEDKPHHYAARTERESGSIFCVTGPLWGESTSDRWIPLKRPVTRSGDVFFDLRLNKRLSKHSIRRWFKDAIALIMIEAYWFTRPPEL